MQTSWTASLRKQIYLVSWNISSLYILSYTQSFLFPYSEARLETCLVDRERIAFLMDHTDISGTIVRIFQRLAFS